MNRYGIKGYLVEANRVHKEGANWPHLLVGENVNNITIHTIRTCARLTLGRHYKEGSRWKNSNVNRLSPLGTRARRWK